VATIRESLGTTMLPSKRKLRISFALSPKLAGELDGYAESFDVSRSAFVEEALQVYLKELGKHYKPATKKRFENRDALVA
jgi:metal-responsive CopG/Arc/MetJ family transcriptional regulator